MGFLQKFYHLKSQLFAFVGYVPMVVVKFAKLVLILHVEVGVYSRYHWVHLGLSVIISYVEVTPNTLLFGHSTKDTNNMLLNSTSFIYEVT